MHIGIQQQTMNMKKACLRIFFLFDLAKVKGAN